MIKWLSIYDLMQDASASEAIRAGDEEKLKSILWSLGFNTSKDIEWQEVIHRPLTAKSLEPIFGMRLVGVERSDMEWRNSGYWSWEAKMENYRENDPEMYKDLSAMSHQHNFTGDIIDHIKNKGSFLDPLKRAKE